MTKIIEKYVTKRIYKSLAHPEFFQRRVSQEKMVAFLDKVFSENPDFECVIEKLSNRLNKKGIDTFKARYRKYKSAQNRRSKSFTLSVSLDTGNRLVELINDMGFDTYDELIDHILSENNFHQ